MIKDTASLSRERLKFFVGLNTGYVTGGRLDERLIEFYRRRSSPALYCAIVGNVVIPGGYGSNDKTPMISAGPEWETLATAIVRAGSLPGIQLATAWEGYIGSKSFRSTASHETIARSRALVRQLGRSAVVSVFKGLDEAAEIATAAGFRHLQVHAAHGYLFNLLVDDRLNEGAEEVLGLLTEWALRCSQRRIETSIRISLKSGDVVFDSDGNDRFYAQIVRLPFDFVDISSGFYNIDKRLIYPARPDLLEARRAESIDLSRRFPDRHFILSGRALLAPTGDLPANLHIGLCRDLIANPDYLLNQRKGCVNSGKCHYFSRGGDHLTCSQWGD